MKTQTPGNMHSVMSGLPESKNRVKTKMRNVLSIVLSRNADMTLVLQT